MKFYTRGMYHCDASTAITLWRDKIEPYARVTINLTEWGYETEDENHVFIPASKLGDALTEEVVEDLVDEVIDVVTYGFAWCCTALYVRLKEEWKEICEEERT